MGKLKKMGMNTRDLRCFETRVSRLISDDSEEYNARVSPIVSLRNRPNTAGVVHKYGKKKNILKSWKHKDCNDIA
jgi:hypothetical protein